MLPCQERDRQNLGWLSIAVTSVKKEVNVILQWNNARMLTLDQDQLELRGEKRQLLNITTYKLEKLTGNFYMLKYFTI